ncbi:MAG: heterotetrameric sarcosine oxidase gamma subunit [Paracoccaceae bacterium]
MILCISIQRETNFVVELYAQSPLEESLPIDIGSTVLIEVTPANITSLMPHKGKEKALDEALKKAHELALPAIGRSTGKADLRMIWTGRGQYMLVGNKPAARSLARSASLTDQTDGWAVMSIEGPLAANILARLCPLDLRASTFKTGHTARSEVAHMMAVVTRTVDGFEIMVMRSFAHTLTHHLKQAMESVAAQSVLA